MAAQAARIRPPAVAGHFYPGDPAQLRSEVEDFLARSAPGPTITPKALIAPHAGYLYSGKIAAAAFATHTLARKRRRASS
jgi:MEMO1 family protein